jgi:thymidine phosphorylase
VIESVEVLSGRGPDDLRALSIELSAWMFFLGERTRSLAEGRRLADTLIASGEAKEKFKQGIALQGGDERVVDEPDRLPGARFHADVSAATEGYITTTECEQFGIALAMLGGGRERKEDTIDPGVSLEFRKRIGDPVKKGESLATIHYNADAKLAKAKSMIAASYIVGPKPPSEIPPLIRRLIGAKQS